MGLRLTRRQMVTLPFGFTFSAAVAALAQNEANAAWPQFRGPDRTGISRETGLLKQWPADGPKLLWKATDLGGTNSAPSVAGGRVFGMSYRGADEFVWALDEATGQAVWSARIAPAHFNIGRQAQDGPGSTPTIIGDRLYALGMSGDLVCMQAADGKLLWQKNLVRDFGGAVPRWGFAESPLVDGEKLIVTPGGAQATLVALNPASGEVIWKSPIGDRAGYSSAIVAEVEGKRQYIQFTGGGVVGVAADDGHLLWRYNAPANPTANCAAPIYHDGHVFAASGYGTGGGLAKLTVNADGTMTATEVYFTKSMQNHHGGMVLVNGYLYGFDQTNLTCLDFKTGEVKWFNRSVGKGSVCYADGLIYARSERGPVAIVEANPAAYTEKSRFTPPDYSGRTTWPYPVIANGRLLLRDQNNLHSFDLKETM